MSLASSRIQTTRPSFRTIRVLLGEEVGAVGVAHGFGREHARAIVLVHQLSPELGVGRGRLSRVAGQLLVAGSHVGRDGASRVIGVDLLDVEDGRVLLDHRAEPELGFAQPFLRFPARAHIGQEAEEVVEVAFLVHDRGGDVVHPYPTAVRVAHPVLVVERFEIRVVERVDRSQVREVVGVHELEPELRTIEEPLGRIPEDASICGLTKPITVSPSSPTWSVYVTAGISSTMARYRASASRRRPSVSICSRDVHHEALPVLDLPVLVLDRAHLVTHPGPCGRRPFASGRPDRSPCPGERVAVRHLDPRRRRRDGRAPTTMSDPPPGPRADSPGGPGAAG